MTSPEIPKLPRNAINPGFCVSTAPGVPGVPGVPGFTGLRAKSLWPNVHSTGPIRSLQSGGHNPGQRLKTLVKTLFKWIERGGYKWFIMG